MLCAHEPEAYDVPASPRWHPPDLPPLDGGLPGWIHDERFVRRVASERAGDIGTTAFWLDVATVLGLVNEVLVSDAADLPDADVARAAMFFLREVTRALPTPMRRRNLVDHAMLRCLPPLGVLSPANPFLVALRLEAERLADAFLNPTDAGTLAMVVDSLRGLLATYAAAANILRLLQESDDDDTTPPDGAA